MFKETRELILRKCHPEREHEIRGIFEKQTFGELERLVTQKLLDVAKTVAKEELGSENWLHLIARLTGRSYEQTRVNILEFLDTDIFNVSAETCVVFLDPLIESWDVDLTTFGIVVVLSRRLAPGSPKRFEFVEREADQPTEEPGLKEFLRDASLSGGINRNEIDFLSRLDSRRNALRRSIITGRCKSERPAPFS